MKKAFAFLLVFTLIATCFPISVFARDNTLHYAESEMFTAQVFDPTQNIETAENTTEEFFTANKFGSYFGAGSYRFYNQLSADEKLIYDAVVSMRGGLDGTDYIPQNQTDVHYKQIQIDLPENFSSMTADNISALKSKLSLLFSNALNCLIDDYPEYYWISLYNYSLSYWNMSDGTVKLAELYARIGIYTEASTYTSWELVEQYYNQINNIITNFEITGSTRYEKLKSIHDQICNLTVYDSNGSMAHEPTGLLLEGKAVCEGYAEVFKMLCDREMIPCINVVGLGDGGAHKWNSVQMEDGKWYGVDVTWDDQTDIYYDYFLVGYDSKVSNSFGGKKTFGSSHIDQGLHYSNATALVYPSLSAEAYMPILPMRNSTAVIDNTRNFVIIPKGAVLKSQFSALDPTLSWYKPSTNAATVSDTTTGAVISITSPVSKTYTVVRKGDVNKDNKVNESDYNEVRSIVQCERPKYTDKAQLAAADINGDGVIDVFDVIELDLYYNAN